MNKIDFSDVLIKILGVAGVLYCLLLVASTLSTLSATVPNQYTWLMLTQLLLFGLISITLFRFSYKISKYLFTDKTIENSTFLVVKNNKEYFILWVKLFGLFLIITSLSQIVDLVYSLFKPLGFISPNMIIGWIIKPLFGIYLLLGGSLIVKIAYPMNKEVEQAN